MAREIPYFCVLIFGFLRREIHKDLSVVTEEFEGEREIYNEFHTETD